MPEETMPNARVLAEGLEFPEGPVAMPDGTIILVEIRGKRLTRIHPDGRKEVIAQVPGGPNGAALGPDGKMWICNNGGFTWSPSNSLAPLQAADYIGGSLQKIDIQSGKIETVFDSCGPNKLKGPNDLVFDRDGGLWFTDLGKRYERQTDNGGLYYMSPGGKDLKEVVFPMQPANGVGLSPDEKTVYVAETPTARIWSFNITGPGEIKPVETLYRGERGVCIAGLGGYQMFDSLAMEANGNVCVATLIKGAISVIAPDASWSSRSKPATRATTNICFGGPDLRTAYITLSSKGQLIAMDWPRPGLPLNFLNK
jgi:gluconolactonase